MSIETETFFGKELIRLPPEERDPVRPYGMRESLNELYVSERGFCWLCGGPCARDHWSMDHVATHNRGGETSSDNAKGAHRLCNSIRGDDMSFLEDVEFTKGQYGYVVPLDKDKIEVPEETRQKYQTAVENYGGTVMAARGPSSDGKSEEDNSAALIFGAVVAAALVLIGCYYGCKWLKKKHADRKIRKTVFEIERNALEAERLTCLALVHESVLESILGN